MTPNIIPTWRTMQPDAFCYYLNTETLFDGTRILEVWNEMKELALKNAELEVAKSELLAALRQIATSEIAVFDEESQDMVMVSMDTYEMIDIAYAAISRQLMKAKNDRL